MTTQTTYSNARANFASLLDEVTKDRETVIIKRRGAEDVAMIAADELRSLLETAHLLSSPANAKRLLAATNRARSGKRLIKMTVDELKTMVNEPPANYKVRRTQRSR